MGRRAALRHRLRIGRSTTCRQPCDVNRHVFLKPHRHAQDVLSAEVLAAFDGRGTVRILERRPDAVVLERLEPATQLAALVGSGDDDEATRILARAIRQMQADTIPPGVPTAADLGASFARCLKDRNNEVPAPLVQTAMHVYFDLCAREDLGVCHRSARGDLDGRGRRRPRPPSALDRIRAIDSAGTLTRTSDLGRRTSDLGPRYLNEFANSASIARFPLS